MHSTFSRPFGTLKTCKACGEQIRQSEFRFTPKTADGVSGTCKRCELVARQKKKRRTIAHYGYDHAAYQEQLAAQGGVCAICGRPPFGKRAFSVDHDHDSGELRALLCGACNSALGLLGDNPATLRAALDYLKRHGKE